MGNIPSILKQTGILALSLMLILSLTACGGQTAAESASEPAVQSTAETAPPKDTYSEPETKSTEDTSAADSTSVTVSYPVTVTDQLGRQVTIEKEPETLVSAYYISTSLLIALGEKDHLVGIEAKAASRSIYQLAAPDLIDLPNVGTAKEFDLEGCAALDPDLIILPVKLKDTVSSLEALGFTVLAVNPEDQELLEEATLLLGTATNTLDTAHAILEFTDECLSKLSNALEGTQAPSVYLAGNSSLLSTAGQAMYQNTLLSNAGGQNVAAELTDSYWSEISYEQLLAWNPDSIILAADADYTVEDVLNDPNLTQCNAVKNGQVYAMPGEIEAWDSPVPGSFLGSLYLASILHPEAYAAADYQEAVQKFYSTFYGFTPELN